MSAVGRVREAGLSAPRSEGADDRDLAPIACGTEKTESRYAVPVTVFVLSRSMLAILAWLAPHLLQPLRINKPVLPRTDLLASAWGWTSPWFRFDAHWYVDVAQHGYRYGTIAHTNTNFFPLYPLL